MNKLFFSFFQVWIFINVFDINIIFSNSISRALFIVLAILLSINKILKKEPVKITNGIKYHAYVFILMFISCIINKGDISLLILFLEGILVYLFIYNIINDEDDINRIIMTIIATATLLSVIGIMEYLFYDKIVKILSYFRTSDTIMYLENNKVRISATFNNPIFFASYIGIALNFILMKFIYAKSIKNKVIYGVVAIINYFALIINNSSGAIIATIFAIIIVYALHKKIYINKFSKFIYTEVLLILLLVAILISNDYIGIDELRNIFTDRVYGWIVALRIFFNNPLIGTGTGSFSKLFYEYGNEFTLLYYFEKYATHSDYLQIIITTGIIGICIYIYTYISYIRNLFNKLYLNNKYTEIYISILGALVFFLIHRSSEDLIFNYRIFCLIYTVLAMSDKVLVLDRKNYKSERERIKDEMYFTHPKWINN